MEVKASLKYVRLTPRKAMLIANLIRGKNLTDALNTLKFSPRRRTSSYFLNLLKSAAANATSAGKVDPDLLFIKSLQVGKGPTLKRFRPRAKGQGFRINKKTCHVFVSLGER